jgi:hypothetical protein
VNAIPLADADLLGVWEGGASCEGIDPVPVHLRITVGGSQEAPLVASILQAGVNTGVVSSEIWGLARQDDGTYDGANLLEEHTAVLHDLARVPSFRRLTGRVTGAWGRCESYEFDVRFILN